MLRRDTSIIFATAHDVGASKLPRGIGTPLDAYLLTTDRPGSLKIARELHEAVGTRLVLFGSIPADPTIVGVEILPGSGRQYGARTRFGVSPPPTLATMSPGEFAISDPVVLVAPSDDAAPPTETAVALPMMATSFKVPASRKVAVYWETYGFNPNDSVDVAVWIERYTSQGLLRRCGNALRVSTDLNTPVAITWREPQPGYRSSVINGRIPIVTRNVVLDTSKLPKGSYWIDVAVAKPGQEPVRSRRSVVVE